MDTKRALSFNKFHLTIVVRTYDSFLGIENELLLMTKSISKHIYSSPLSWIFCGQIGCVV
jgi:hypothetical protein